MTRQSRLLRFGAALLAALVVASADQSPPLDHYVLALSWQPAFCQSNMDKPECRDLDSGDFAASHLSIHGLWPDLRENKRLRYCDIDEHVELIDQRNRWCELPEPDLSAATRGALDRAMPGAASCLDRHEWIEHGSCAGVDAEGYFTRTLRLAAAVQDSPFGALLSASVGQTVSRKALIGAFERAYGPGAGWALTLLCARDLLIEVRITLELSAMQGELGPDDLRPSGGLPRGSCPARIKIDPVGP